MNLFPVNCRTWRYVLKKVFNFESARDWYVCDAAILSCFDNRFDLGFRKFLKRIGVTNPDHIRVGGGVKNLASPDSEADREFVLDQIRKSIRLHGTRRMILVSHSDCGAYGRLEAFHGDHNAEARHHQREQARAAANLLEIFPALEVQGYFIDFEGIWDAEIDQLPAASGQ